MYHFDATALSAADQYKFLSGSIIPRPIAWITTQNAKDRSVNLAPFSFFTGLSNQLPLVSVAILRRGDQPKDTAANLMAWPQGVIHLVSHRNIQAMNQSAASLAPGQSEVTELALPTVTSQKVAVPGLADALIRLEVSVYQYVPVKAPAGQVMTDLFILRIEAFHFADSVFDPTTRYLNVAAFDPVARLAGPTYAHLGDTYTLKRPR